MCGKTTIGKMVAEKLGWSFIDTDRLIENAYTEKTGKTCTCRQIYIEEGDSLFRECEKMQIASLSESVKSIIAVGGGSLNDPENTKMLQLTGSLVYLKAPLSALWERMLNRGIPVYLNSIDPEKAFYEIANKRTPIYEDAASYIIETSHLCEQEVVAAILNLKGK